MQRLILIAALAAASTTPAMAAPGGPIGTLSHGHYRCELPGDAEGPVGIHQPEQDFEVTNSSSYRTPKGMGIYLLTGDRLVFTSGPFDGAKFHRVGSTTLRRTEADGSDGTLRCVLSTRANR